VPLVVVSGEEDVEPLDRVEAEVGGDIPGIKLIILEDVGHLALFGH
jgi:hypothetical protein